MAAQPGMGPARPPDPRGIRDRTLVSGLARTAAADRGLPGPAREGGVRTGVLRGAERGAPGAHANRAVGLSPPKHMKTRTPGSILEKFRSGIRDLTHFNSFIGSHAFAAGIGWLPDRRSTTFPP